MSIKFTIPLFCGSKPGIFLKRAPKLDWWGSPRTKYEENLEISLFQKLKILCDPWRKWHQIDMDRSPKMWRTCSNAPFSLIWAWNPWESAPRRTWTWRRAVLWRKIACHLEANFLYFWHGILKINQYMTIGICSLMYFNDLERKFTKIGLIF